MTAPFASAALATAVAVLMLSAATVNAQTSACVQQLSPGRCYGLSQEGHYCLWSSTTESCVEDSCANAANAQACLNHGCLPMPWFSGTYRACVNPLLLCNRLRKTDCDNTNFCAWRTDYCSSIQEPVPGKTDAECDVKFPAWSVALIVVWLCLMLILCIILILIYLRNRNNDFGGGNMNTIDPTVDGMAGQRHQDTFTLSSPLNN